MSNIDFSTYKTQTQNDHINKYERCGDETIRYINWQNPSLVLDLGCGDNAYKPFIPNLIGIDIVNIHADINCDISKLDFEDNSADFCLAFGSINFGSEETIKVQLLELHRVLKIGGTAIFRGNESSEEPYYGWTKQNVYTWADAIGFRVTYTPVPIRRLNVWGQPAWISKNDKRSLNTLQRSNTRLYWHYTKKRA